MLNLAGKTLVFEDFHFFFGPMVKISQTPLGSVKLFTEIKLIERVRKSWPGKC